MMRRSTSIFDSISERALFGDLESRFAGLGRLVPQLPLAKLVTLERADDRRLSWAAKGFFYKTNVDYTFTDNDDRPLFSIEFDGIGGGHSRMGRYFPARLTSDQMRVRKLDFKLRVTREVGYPLIVVSFDETQTLREGDSMTILDGLVGYFLTRLNFQGILDRQLEEAQADLESLPDDLKYEQIQDIVFGAEIEAEMMYDPLARATAEMQTEIGGVGHHERWLYDPPLPEFDTGPSIFMNPEELRQRHQAMQAAVRVGARATAWAVRGSKFRSESVTETVWLRNVGSEFGTIEIVANNLASYLAFSRLREMHRSGTLDLLPAEDTRLSTPF